MRPPASAAHSPGSAPPAKPSKHPLLMNKPRPLAGLTLFASSKIGCRSGRRIQSECVMASKERRRQGISFRCCTFSRIRFPRGAHGCGLNVFAAALILAAWISAVFKRALHLSDDFLISPFQRPERSKNACPLLDWRCSPAADGHLLGELRDFQEAHVFLSCRQSADSCGRRSGRVLRFATSAQISFHREKRFPAFAIRRRHFPPAPLQSESAAHIAGRSELVSGFFVVAAWLVFLNHFETRMTITTTLKILLLSAAALLGKESAISLPALLLATDFYWNPASLHDQLRDRWKLYPRQFSSAVWWRPP